MIGAVIIDGTDISTMGMFIVKGGDNGFLVFPERKEPLTNDWFEEDGLDVDLSEVFFEAKKLSVKFYLTAADATTFKARLTSFATLLFQPGYRQIYVREFDKTFSLRFKEISDYKHSGGLAKSGKKSGFVTVEFMMDDPLAIYNATLLPVTTRPNLSRIKLNGLDLSRFGIVIQDVYSSALRIRSPKAGLALNFERRTGILTDLDFIPKKAGRQITIACTMLADSLSEFYSNYNALFNQLTITQALDIELPTTEVINCYYKRMDDFSKEMAFGTRIKLKFNLILIEL
ncbi:MAG: hypothetical protein JXR34_12180 [Bacteroidales bacterium]|nr:hypothetical protein [Bacteroidales bacterium]